MEVNTAQILARVTTQYSDVEDRIRLSGELPSGVTVVLWLSQRLVRRLVPSLAKWLEKEANHLPMPELRQEMTQQAAEAGLKPAAPVQTAPQVAGELVTEVDLTYGEDAVRITFKKQGMSPIILPMSKMSLRQWLGILRGAFERAEWPLDVWPGWSLPEDTSTGTSGSIITH